jgi:hypothetical protein
MTTTRLHKQEKQSRYLYHDFLCTQIARLYSNELKQPFFVSIGDYGPCDIQSADGTLRIEVKLDTTSIRTKSIALEYFNTETSTASGILSTRANTWLHIVLENDGHVAYEFCIDDVRRLALDAGVTKRAGYNSLIKVVPLELARAYARRSFPFTPINLN